MKFAILNIVNPTSECLTLVICDRYDHVYNLNLARLYTGQRVTDHMAIYILMVVIYFTQTDPVRTYRTFYWDFYYDYLFVDSVLM